MELIYAASIWGLLVWGLTKMRLVRRPNRRQFPELRRRHLWKHSGGR